MAYHLGSQVSSFGVQYQDGACVSTTSSIKHTGVRHKRACVSLLLLGVTLGGHLEALAVRLAGWPVERELVERVFAPCSKVGATGRLY